VGALWGLGHSTGQLILGLAMVVLKDRFAALVPALTRWGGAAVGLTLLAIGALGLFEAFAEGGGGAHGAEDAEIARSAEAAAAAGSATAAFAAGADAAGAGAAAPSGRFGLATYATGIVYGLQPDALFVIVPALALPTKAAAAAYILTFVLGTVGAMGAYTGAIAATSAAIRRTNAGLTRKLSGAASLVAVAIGAGVLLSAAGVAPAWLGWLGGR
jgi:hypothetical protein